MASESKVGVDNLPHILESCPGTFARLWDLQSDNSGMQ